MKNITVKGQRTNLGGFQVGNCDLGGSLPPYHLSIKMVHTIMSTKATKAGKEMRKYTQYAF